MTAGAGRLAELLLSDPWRRDVLTVLRDLSGGQAWIGAGFVRNPIWDSLFGVTPEPLADVDVVTFGAGDPSDLQHGECLLHRALTAAMPDVPWQVRDQARMHLTHGHPPYTSLEDALSRWPETATANAVRLTDDETLAVCAPYGVSDLLGGILRAGPRTVEARKNLDERARRKGWFQRWPGLQRGSDSIVQ